jgi:hypothetical protein
MNLTVGLGACESAVGVLASRTDHKLSDASLNIKFYRWVLRCETLVVMVMPVYYYLPCGQNMPLAFARGKFGAIIGAEF